MAADKTSLWLTTEDNLAERVDLHKRQVTATGRVSGSRRRNRRRRRMGHEQGPEPDPGL